MNYQTAPTSSPPAAERWYAGVTRYQWLVLVIASLGWVFDIFEGQIFVAALNEAMPDLMPPGAGKDELPFYANITFAAFLVGGALGGAVFGRISDRFGREVDEHVAAKNVPCRSEKCGFTGLEQVGTPIAHAGAQPRVHLPATLNGREILLAQGGRQGAEGALAVDAAVGVRQLDMPASPERVWQAIQDAKKNGQQPGGAA